MVKNNKISIIGAGLYGLTLGKELTNLGFEVELYEQSNKAGGLLRSTKVNCVNIDYNGFHSINVNKLIRFPEVRSFFRGLADYQIMERGTVARINVGKRLKYIRLPLSKGSLLDFYEVSDIDGIASYLLDGTSGMKYKDRFVQDIVDKIGYDLYDYIIRPLIAKEEKQDYSTQCNIDKIKKITDDEPDVKTVSGYEPYGSFNNVVDVLCNKLKINYNVDVTYDKLKSITENSLFTYCTNSPCDYIDGGPRYITNIMRLETSNVLYDSKTLANTIVTPTESYDSISRFNVVNGGDAYYCGYNNSVIWNKFMGLNRFYIVDEPTDYFKMLVKKFETNNKLKFVGRLGTMTDLDMIDTVNNALETAHNDKLTLESIGNFNYGSETNTCNQG